MFIEGSAFVIRDANAFCVALASTAVENWFGHDIKRNSESVIEAHLNKAFFYVTKVGTNKYLVKVMLNVDVHLPFVP